MRSASDRASLALGLALALGGCSLLIDVEYSDAGRGMDAGVDAAMDAGRDAGEDTPDADVATDSGDGDGGGLDAGAVDGGPADSGRQDSGAPDAGPPIDAGPAVGASDYCSELAALECEAYLSCCDEALRDAVFEANCMTTLQSACMMRLDDLLTNTADSGYEPHLAAAALDEARTLTQTCDLGFADWLVGRDGVYAPFLGSLPVDAECVQPGAEPADDAYFANFVCADGRTCIDQGASGWACRPLGSNPCRNYLDCPSGQFCTGADVCEVQRGDGDFCNPLNPIGCASLDCTGINCVARTQEFVYCVHLESGGV